MQQLNKLFFLLVIICFFSCSENKPHNVKTCKLNTDSISSQKKIYTEKQLIDSSLQYLENGTIVLRTGNDAISYLFSQLNKTNKTFSHCGIAFQENNNWYVYHSIGGEDNPDEKLRKELYESFVGKSHNKGFGICQYNLKNNEIDLLQQTVHLWHQKQVPFDMKFDLGTDDRLYCAEMVFKSFNKACNTDSFFNTTWHNGFRYVSTDNIFVNKDAQMLCHIVY